MLHHEAVTNGRELFPNPIDDSGVTNDVDVLEELTGLATRVETVVDKETGEVRTTEEEEDVNIEQQLLEHVSEHAATLGIFLCRCR